jgi:preprotein translocase subunit Sss1
LPFRGRTVPDLKNNDPFQKLPQEGIQVHLDILEMAKEVDRKRYIEIIQIITNGFGILGVEEREYDPEAKNWKIMLRWYETYSYLPKDR